MKQIIQKYISDLFTVLQNIYIKFRKRTIKNKLLDLISFMAAYFYRKSSKKNANKSDRDIKSLGKHKTNRKSNSLVIENPMKPMKKNKFRIMLLFFIILFSEVAVVLIKSSAMHQESLQMGIAENIIRFHVIANSDSNRDQELKLKVKAALVDYLSPQLGNTQSITQAHKILESNLVGIKNLAEETLQSNGCDDRVNVTLQACFFPLKVYGGYTFPPGTYEALRVQIGDAEGKNWWCVMFPPLCFVDETYAIIDDDTKEQLKHLLTEEEYDTLLSQKTSVKVKFKIWEELKKLF